MNRAKHYQTQIINKLLSSKFLYSTPSNIPLPANQKLIIKGSSKAKNPEVSASTINILFSQKPAFDRTLRRLEKEYLLVHLTLTSNRKQTADNLDHLASLIIPFQLENQLFPVKGKNEGEISWTIEGCTPATPLHPLIFPYPIHDERFNLTVFFLTNTNIPHAHSIFYLNLFQLPVTTLNLS